MYEEQCSNTSPLPSEIMPDCWKDEERMNALFSAFRNKTVNPQDWISKYRFWHDLIYRLLKHTMKCNFSLSDLNEAFKRNGCAPLCLKTVVEELISNNEIVREEEFLKEPCDTWTAWSINVIKSPITWSFSKMKSYVIGHDIDIETKYVHIQIVEELADVILTLIENPKENVVMQISDVIQHCRQKTNNEHITEHSVKLALVWLRHKRKVVFHNSSASSTVEILVKLSLHTADKVSDIEKKLYILQKFENQLTKEIENLEQQKLNHRNEAKTYLAKQLRQTAINHLKKKAVLDKVIQKRVQVLDKLRDTILTIQDAQLSSVTIEAYKHALDAFKEIRNSGLSEFHVRDVMDDVTESLQEQKEIESALTETVQLDETNSDIEKELEELLNSSNLDVPSDLENQSKIEDLEQRFTNLRVKDLPSPTKTSLKSTQSQQKQKLTQLTST